MHFSIFIQACLCASGFALSLPAAEHKPRHKRSGTYGSVVDTVDAAPNPSQTPGTLPNRGSTSLTVSGNYSPACSGCLGGSYDTFYSGQNVGISGSGYISVDWEIGYGNSAGEIVMPSWTGLTGKLFHVASGGGHRMDDLRVNCGGTCCTDQSWMGCPGTSAFDTLPSGCQQMWQVEYYYLENGSVTLNDNENGVDYDLGVSFVDYQDIVDDLNRAYDSSDLYAPVLRYGLVRDTGDDNCPVPQYLTRDSPSDPSTVAQQSDVS